MQRVAVWVVRPKNRPSLQLQWRDPQTGRRRTRSAGTSDHGEARQKAADLAYELSHGFFRRAGPDHLGGLP